MRTFSSIISPRWRRSVLSASSEPLILAFDTTSARCAVAVLRGDEVVFDVNEPMTKGQAERLFPMIEAALDHAGARVADLSAIGLCTGPGNFTGARIAVSAARGLSMSTGAPAIGVDRFDALHIEGADWVTIAGPRDQIYWRSYSGELSEGFGGLETLAAEIAPRGRQTVVGPAAARLADMCDVVALGETDVPSAAHIARIAAKRLGRENGRPKPLYLKSADAAPGKAPLPSLSP